MSDRDDRQTDAEESEEEEEDIPATQADEDFAWLELRQVGGGGRFSFADASTCKIGPSRSNRAMDLQLDVGVDIFSISSHHATVSMDASREVRLAHVRVGTAVFSAVERDGVEVARLAAGQSTRIRIGDVVVRK